jgi:hypothetical protein
MGAAVTAAVPSARREQRDGEDSAADEPGCCFVEYFGIRAWGWFRGHDPLVPSFSFALGGGRFGHAGGGRLLLAPCVRCAQSDDGRGYEEDA